jgi:hypothetical protein
VTPSKVKSLPWDETVKICRDFTLNALQTLAAMPRKEYAPLRFVYVSGHYAPRSEAAITVRLADQDIMALCLLRVRSSAAFRAARPRTFMLTLRPRHSTMTRESSRRKYLSSQRSPGVRCRRALRSQALFLCRDRRREPFRAFQSLSCGILRPRCWGRLWAGLRRIRFPMMIWIGLGRMLWVVVQLFKQKKHEIATERS